MLQTVAASKNPEKNSGPIDYSIHLHYGKCVQCGVVWCGVVWCGMVWRGMVWCGVVWHGVVWCGVV